MKTFQFKLLPNDNEKLIIDNSIFVKNQVRNFLIDLFSYNQDLLDNIYKENQNINIKDINLDKIIKNTFNKSLLPYINQTYFYIPIKGKNKDKQLETILLESKIVKIKNKESDNSDNNKLYLQLFIKDKSKLRDILKSLISKYLQDRNISIKGQIKLSKPIQLIVEDFLKNFNKINNSNKDFNFNKTGSFIDGSFENDFNLSLIYPKKYNKLTNQNNNPKKQIIEGKSKNKKKVKYKSLPKTKNKIGLLKLGKDFSCRIKLSQKLKGKIKYYILKKNNLNQYFINIVCEVETNQNDFSFNDFLLRSGTRIQKEYEGEQSNIFFKNFKDKYFDNQNLKICSIDLNFENITIMNIKDNSFEQIPLFNKELLKEKFNHKKTLLQTKLNKIIFDISKEKYDLSLDFDEEKLKYSWKKLNKEEKKEFRRFLLEDKDYVQILKKIKKIDKTITNKQNNSYKLIISKLVQQYDLFILEHLNVNNMVKENEELNSKDFNKRLYNVGLSKFQTMILNKIKLTSGKSYIVVDSFNNSIKCNNCNYISKDNRLNQSTFLCKKCNYNFNADCNATINIYVKFKELFKEFTATEFSLKTNLIL